MSSPILRRTALGVLAAAFAGCASGAPRGGGGSAAAAPGLTPEAAAEFEALYRARVDSVPQRHTEAEVGFVTAMIGHHAQALLMAGLADGRAGSRSIRTLAGRITNAQQDEIVTMRQWLLDRGRAAPDVHIDVQGLALHGAEHADHMPGMATADELRALAAARGNEFDRLFLRLMIRHHGGAAAAVRELFETPGFGNDVQLFRIASDIHVDQVTEIARMEQMLSELSSSGNSR